MSVMEKPSLDDLTLQHFGSKGMKWGVRKGKKTTGISRSRGAIVDYNDRSLKSFRSARTALQTGHGARGIRIANRINRMTMGKKLTEKYYNTKITKMTEQNARVKSGKLRFNDRVRSAGMMTMPLDMLVSIRPT